MRQKQDFETRCPAPLCYENLC